MLGEERNNDLRDAFRVYLDNHPELMREIVRERPSGPLAVSHIRGNQHKRTESRYDFILVSPEIAVYKVEFLYDEAVKAGSDHALVIGEFRVDQGLH